MKSVEELDDSGCRLKKAGYFVLGTGIEAVGRGIQLTGAYCALFAPSVGLMLQNGIDVWSGIGGKNVPIELRYAASNLNGGLTTSMFSTGNISFPNQSGAYNISYTLPNKDMSYVNDIAKIATPFVACLGLTGVFVGSEVAKLGSYIRGDDTSFKEALLGGARDTLAASSVALFSTATNLAIVNEGVKIIPNIPEKVGHKGGHSFNVRYANKIKIMGIEVPFSINAHADASGSGYADLRQFSKLKDSFSTPENMIFLMYGGSALCMVSAMGLNSLSNHLGEKRITSGQENKENEYRDLRNDSTEDSYRGRVSREKQNHNNEELKSVLVNKSGNSSSEDSDMSHSTKVQIQRKDSERCIIL
jgi:hypothetical protein